MSDRNNTETVCHYLGEIVTDAIPNPDFDPTRPKVKAASTFGVPVPLRSFVLVFKDRQFTPICVEGSGLQMVESRHPGQEGHVSIWKDDGRSHTITAIFNSSEVIAVFEGTLEQAEKLRKSA